MARATSAPIDKYLKELWERNGTDLMLTAGAPPLVRIDGMVRPVDGNKQQLSPADTERLIMGILTPELREEFQRSKEVDFSFNWQETARFRANAFMQRGSMGI